MLQLLLAALQLPPRVIDAGRITEADGRVTWFGCVLSAGFDAVVNERAKLMRWPRGRSRYNLALLRELALLKPIGYRLTLDGVVSETRAMLVAAGTCRYIVSPAAGRDITRRDGGASQPCAEVTVGSLAMQE